MAREKHQTIKELDPSDDEVLEVTGPVIWTHAVMDSLSEAIGSTMTYHNKTSVDTARLYRDILVLPINGFGMDQEHSGSARGEAHPAALAQHRFNRSWMHGWNNPIP